MIQNKNVALIYRGLSLILTAAGLVTHLGLLSGEFRIGLFMYYTVQSNLLALVLFTLLVFRTIKELGNQRIESVGYYSRFEMVCVVDLMLTFLVYWIMLAPRAAAEGDVDLLAFKNTGVHAITPLLYLFDYILFSSPRHLKYKDVYLVLCYPLFYVAFTSAAGFAGYVYEISAADSLPVRFPYFFYDYDRTGAASFLYIAVLFVFFLSLSHIFYLFDQKVRRFRR